MKKKNKGFLLATAATGAAAFAPGAMAADLPAKAPAPVVVPAASWAGWYIGAHAGVAWHQAHTADIYTGIIGSSATGTGFIGGGQIGYNWQRGNFVFGIEADGSWLNAKAENTNTVPDGTYGTEHNIRWMSTVRSRFGLAVGDTMAYVTGGVAFGGVKNRELFGSAGEISQSKTRVGWTVGGGIEHMWSRNFTIALEGLFVDLGRSNVVQPGGLGFNKTTRFHNQAVIGRLKANYKW
ncbi:MAG TPA: outer membrane beta-barrel protein [Xanthobacteraceae bacterium]|nr:outer membrane beta-barrel protein [Xanthobacteraceae bacterium]